MNRYFALAYAAGASAVYLVLAALASLDTGFHAPPYVFEWWHPALAAVIGSVSVIAPAIYLGSRQPEECRECVKAARRYARLETERDELKKALVELPVERITGER